MLSIGNLTASPGQKISGNVPIQPAVAKNNSSSNSLCIPITTVNGAEDGPTLVILSGIHGSEYVPIRATQRLAKETDPSTLKGGLILVHIANLPAYLGRTIYTSPKDGKNLNRVFPGSPTGTPTEQIADFLVNEVYPLADALLDMHSGDANEQLGPSYTAYYGKAGSPENVQKSKDMAFAFGVNLVVEFQWELQGDDNITMSGAIWAGSAAVARGIPSIDVEAAPGMGESPSESINDVFEGVRNVMRHLGMLEQEVKTPNGQKNDPCLVTERHFIDAPVEGSWIPSIDTGTFVAEGDVLGTITDFTGRNSLFVATSPSDGLLLIRLETPPVLAGDPLAVIAILETEMPSCERLKRTTLQHAKAGVALLSPSNVELWQWTSIIGWLVAIGLGLVLGKTRRNESYEHQTAHHAVPAEDSSIT